MTLGDSFSDLTLHSEYVPQDLVERQLIRASRQPAALPDLYAALLDAKVYVVNAEPVLEDDGPAVMLPVQARDGVPFLRLYTARSRLPAGATNADVTSLPFSTVIRAVDPVEVVLDAGTSCELIISARHVAVLRDVLGQPSRQGPSL